MSGLSKYVLGRLLAMVPMLIGISLLLFILMNMAPGGPEYVIVGDLERYSPRLVEQIRAEFGLDKPIHVRYGIWLGNALRGNFGVSTTTVGGVPVMELISERFLATIQLTGFSLLLSVIVAIPLGILSAVKRYSTMDKVITFTAFTGICFPTFWLGVMLILLFSVTLGWLPASGIAPHGMRGVLGARLMHSILPVFTLSAVQMGRYLRFTRSSILEVMREDYIRTARAKGLADRAVLFKHALRNAMIQIVTVIGLSLPALVGGSVLVETVFAWPGLGRLAVQAISRRDYMTVMGVQLVIATATLLANIVVDLVYALIDPRISYS